MFDILKRFGRRDGRSGSAGEQSQKSALMERCERFTARALEAKTTEIVPFLELPVYLTVLFQAKGKPPMPDAVRHVMEAEEKLSFKCVECGDLNPGLVVRAYSPQRVAEEDELCPNCRGSNKVEMTYDPSRPTTFERVISRSNTPIY